MTSTTNEKLLLEPEQSDFEKISCKIHTLKKDHIFKSFRDLCIFFGFKSTGGDRKKTILNELSRHCTCEKMEKSNKYIIIEVFASTLPKLDKKFINSEYYPMCSYLLLVFLAEKFSYEDKDIYYLTTGKIMKIAYLCNDNYSKTKLNLAKQDSESTFFIREVKQYLSNLTQKMLASLKSHKLLNFNKCYMLIDKHNKHCEATDEETKIIDEYYKAILKKYNIKTKQAIQFSRYKKEIDSKFEEHLGFKHYSSNKFNIIANLDVNAGHLRNKANLTSDCGPVVNSLICSDIYNLVFNRIINIRKNEPKLFDIQQAINDFTAESFEKEIHEVIEECLSKGITASPVKYTNIWNFNSDDDIVKYRIESLIDRFIRTECNEYQQEQQ